MGGVKPQQWRALISAVSTLGFFNGLRPQCLEKAFPGTSESFIAGLWRNLPAGPIATRKQS